MSDDGKIVALRDRLNNVEEVQPPAVDNCGDDTPKPADGDLPEGCPVEGLGIQEGVFWIVDSACQLRAIKSREFNKNMHIDLFSGNVAYLARHFPRYTSKGAVDTFEGEALTAAIIAACARKGPFNPSDKIRGLGAWSGADGQLELHHGDKLTIVTLDGNEWQIDPGVHNGFVYPAAAPMPRPCAKGAEGVDTVGEDLFKIVNGFGWKRGDLDAHLVGLGAMGLASIAGAVPWRPVVWYVGPRGCGKSTLLGFHKSLLGGEAIASNDFTGAGIRQVQKYGSRPFFGDEFEAKRDNRSADNSIEIFRIAASGGTMIRGGADHQATEFAARGSFVFGSILPPPLKPQDMSRVVVGELIGPPKDKRPPSLTENEWNALGVKMRRRMVDGWPRYHPTLDAYRAGLIEQGHDRRGADTYGTLLACADILRFHGDVNPETVAEFVSQLSPSSLMAFDEQSEGDSCLQHLLTSSIRVSSTGAFETISELVLVGNDGQLRKHGLGLTDRGGERCLIVAYNHAALGKIYQDTRWNKEAGTTGGWPTALQRLPGATGGGPRKFAGVQARCVFIPLDQILGGDDAD